MANPSDEQQWKEQWQKAFEEAEVTPSPHVWNNIDHKLTLQEGIKYRRGFLIYRGVAAALLLLIGGLSWYILSHQNEAEHQLVTDSESSLAPDERANSNQEQSTASGGLSTLDSSAVANPSPDRSRRSDQPNPDKANTSRSPQPPQLAASSSDPAAADRTVSEQSGASESPRSGTTALLPENQPTSPSAVGNPTSSRTAKAALTGNSARPANYVATVASSPADGSSERLSPVSQTLYYVPQPFAAAADKKEGKSSSPTFFAGLALAPGYFDPQFEASAADLAVAGPSVPAAAPGFRGISNSEDAAFVPSPATNVDNEQALSFSYGLDVGMRLSDHWVVESGLDYSRFSTTSETRWAIADIASGERYPYLAANRSALSYDLNANASPARVAATPVDNAYDFIALPLKIGYRRAIDRLQFTISSGVAANFFLGNDISAVGEGFGNYRLSASDEGSPFRSLYYSGVVSGGVNYNVLGGYFLSLTPSYSFALTELTREASGISSQPRSFGVNFGIEYQF